MNHPGRIPLPLAGRYGAAVALALLALTPNIVFTTAFPLLQGNISQALHTSAFAARIAETLSNAAYAFGAIAAADLAQRFSQRRLFLFYEAIFIVGSLVVLFATGPAMFIVGRILQGLGTGLLLVAALPPLVTKFPTAMLPLTAIWINIGLFGAVTLGPLIGGLSAHYGAWRLLFAGLAGLGLTGFLIAMLTLELAPGSDPDQPIDWPAFPLAAAATALPFFGVAWLTNTSFLNPRFLLPVVLGLLALVVLIRSQYKKQEAFIPVGPLFSTLPLCGILSAMVAGAAFVTLLELSSAFLGRVAHRGALAIGLLLTPELLGLLAATLLFRKVLRTRGLPVLALSGMLAIVAGAAVLVPLGPANDLVLVPIAMTLLGYGAGAAVAPSLFVAGMSVAAAKLGRTFALVELLRSEAAYLIGPVLLSIAERTDTSLGSGLHLSIWLTLAIAAIGTAGIAVLFGLGGADLQRPEIESWLEHGGRAFHSPPLFARLRS